MSLTQNSIKIGFAVPSSGPWATPDNQVRVAERAEELGYQSLWTFSRLLYPLETDDPHWTPPFSPAFLEVHEPIVTLAHLAGRTERIRLGVSVLNLPFYSPLLLGKQLIELDIVSGGRLDIGVGTGWSVDEFRAVGVPMERRVGRMTEYLRVLRAMWENEETRFEGEFTELPKTLVRPRPVQPQLPVLLGGSGEKAWRRAGRLAIGWVGPGFVEAQEVREAANTVRQAVAEAHGDPGAARIVLRATVQLRSSNNPDRALFSGSLEEIRSDLAMVTELGATEVFMDLNFDEEIVSPSADPAVSMKRAEEVLEAFAPTVTG